MVLLFNSRYAMTALVTHGQLQLVNSNLLAKTLICRPTLEVALQ